MHCFTFTMWSDNVYEYSKGKPEYSIGYSGMEIIMRRMFGHLAYVQAERYDKILGH